MIGWNFPSNGGGQINGVADSGIQIFKGKEIASLAREICQNSLDAAINENVSVTVEFRRSNVDTKKIPGYDDYQKVLQACQTYWTGNNDAQAFLANAMDRMKFPTTPVLQISDFNTTGLIEPYNPRSMQGWNTLTKIAGGATKPSDKAGSFGIGKNAPFANSFLRMVFYRTLNAQGERAAQAVAKLVSFNLTPHDISAGTGYYGETDGNMPVQIIPALEKISKRTHVGTDVFIYGFNGENTWAFELIGELIENFLVAIYRDKLRVTVQGQKINRQVLRTFVRNNTANYYKILTGDDAVKFFELPFHGMGTLKLGVLLDQKNKLNRRVLIVRKSGMKLFELDRFSRTLNFTAILELEGLELNAFFRQMETPDHTKWEPSRHPTNRKRAKLYLDELKRWVRDIISKLSEVNVADEIDVKGLGQLLDFDYGAIDGGGKTKSTTHKRTTEMTLIPENLPKTKRNNDKNNPQKSSTSERILTCDKVRVIRLDEAIYRLILKVPRNVLNGRIEILAVGENNFGERLFVSMAESIDLNSLVFTVDNKIHFEYLLGNIDAKIDFRLQDEKNYALGVAVYED